MSYFSGRNGQLSIKDADSNNYRAIGRLRNWTVSAATETIDTTCLYDLDKTILPGLRSYSGSATLLYYNVPNNDMSDIESITKDTFKEGNSQYQNAEFGNTAAKPETVKIELKLNTRGKDNTKKIEMFAVVTGFNMTCSVGEVVSADVSWTGHGAPDVWDV